MGLGAVSLAQVATLGPDASLRLLGSGREGLPSAERGASRSVGRTRSARTSFGDIKVEQFRSGISLLLTLAGLLTVAVGSLTDGAVDPLCDVASAMRQRPPSRGAESTVAASATPPLAGSGINEWLRMLVTGATRIGRERDCSRAPGATAPRPLAPAPERARVLFGARVETVAGDLGDPERLRLACQGMGQVCHVAGAVDTHRHGDAEIVDTNVEGTRRLLAAAHATGVSGFVYTSSVSVYGDRLPLGVAESAPLKIRQASTECPRSARSSWCGKPSRLVFAR